MEWIAAVQQVGFPIVACFGMGWMFYKFSTKMGEAIERNTSALNEMHELIKILQKTIEDRKQ